MAGTVPHRAPALAGAASRRGDRRARAPTCRGAGPACSAPTSRAAPPRPSRCCGILDSRPSAAHRHGRVWEVKPGPGRRPRRSLQPRRMRAEVSCDENDQAATADAVRLLHLVAEARMRSQVRTVVDATNVEADARRPLLKLADDCGGHGHPAGDLPGPELAPARPHPGRPVGPAGAGRRNSELGTAPLPTRCRRYSPRAAPGSSPARRTARSQQPVLLGRWPFGRYATTRRGRVWSRGSSTHCSDGSGPAPCGAGSERRFSFDLRLSTPSLTCGQAMIVTATPATMPTAKLLALVRLMKSAADDSAAWVVSWLLPSRTRALIFPGTLDADRCVPNGYSTIISSCTILGASIEAMGQL